MKGLIVLFLTSTLGMAAELPWTYEWSHPSYGSGSGKCRVLHNSIDLTYELAISGTYLAPEPFDYGNAIVRQRGKFLTVYESRKDSSKEAEKLCRRAQAPLIRFERTLALSPQRFRIYEEIHCGFDVYELEFDCYAP